MTATKIEKDIDQVTDAVTVIDEESIKDSALTDLSDILRFTPGIGFKRVGGPGQAELIYGESFAIREAMLSKLGLLILLWPAIRKIILLLCKFQPGPGSRSLCNRTCLRHLCSKYQKPGATPCWCGGICPEI